MREPRRIDEIITPLTRFALGEVDVSGPRLAAALRLLDLAIGDVPPDDGTALPALADDEDVLVFVPKFAA